MMERELIKQNRKFGYTVAIALLVLAAFRIFIRHKQGWWVAFAIAIVLLLFSLLKPVLLNPLRLVWDKIGHVLSIINTYVLLTVFYFFILSPLGMIMRLFGKDILKIKWLKNKDTYWEDASLKEVNNMENQF
ncbi:SxtJ family membrane protein [Mucilaginibacter sp. L196]|uniref:SxtJ family membrane protein n=1 Tax=Mucilaginibacter sp. L196 TaxID=1641870 RepID=UPI00131CF6D8|nr:SxtJ family membrane protein [Mucilaginibacter sp. L196]